MRGDPIRVRQNDVGRNDPSQYPQFETDRVGYDDLDANSAEEVIGEIGLVLVIALGLVLAINMVLVAFNVS